MDQIEEQLQGTATDRVDFFACFRQYIEESTAKGLRNYKAAYNSLQRFINRPTMDCNEMTYTLLTQYAATLTGRTPSLYIGAIRHVYQWARLRYNDEERGIVRIPYNPFERFRVPRQPVAEKRSLPADTIRRLFALPYQQTQRSRDRVNRYNLALDMFRLSFCLAGMNAADLYDCTEIDGNALHYYRVKTRERRKDRAEMRIIIPPYAQTIAARYIDSLRKRAFRFYRMYKNENDFVRAINLGLKEIGAELGIERLQFYAARHSWATIARNDLHRPFGGQLRVQETPFVYDFVNNVYHIVYHIVYQKAKPAGVTYWLNALHIFAVYLTAIMSTVQPNAFAIACRVSKPTE